MPRFNGGTVPRYINSTNISPPPPPLFLKAYIKINTCIFARIGMGDGSAAGVGLGKGVFVIGESDEGCIFAAPF